jgi:ankyrin repeat protein
MNKKQREEGGNGMSRMKIGSGIVLLMLFISVTAFAEDLNQKLTDAAVRGQTEIVTDLLSRNADVNAKDMTGSTALALAASNGHTETVKVLLARGAMVNLRNKFGFTALFCAASNGHPETVAVLLANGAQVNEKINDGWTALITAAQEGHTEIVKVLLANGANINERGNHGRTVLMWAAGYENRGALDQLAVARLVVKDNGESEKNHIETVKVLLAHGADTNAKDDNDATALMLAAQNGHSEIVRLLKDAGAVR